ncbi:MAG TPA: hypothetical protein VGP33_08985 [Chloroflexota bacterium]|nr:hypothetical protein [Chloroflexota bacterium]
MRWRSLYLPCRRILPVVTACCPFLLEPQAINLALLIGAILAKRSLCLTTLAKAFLVLEIRQVPAAKHELLHRLQRLSRFLGNDQVDPVAVQVASIPAILRKLGSPRRRALPQNQGAGARPGRLRHRPRHGLPYGPRLARRALRLPTRRRPRASGCLAQGRRKVVGEP